MSMSFSPSGHHHPSTGCAYVLGTFWQAGNPQQISHPFQLSNNVLIIFQTSQKGFFPTPGFTAGTNVTLP